MDQVAICVAAFCGKQAGLMHMHLFSKKFFSKGIKMDQVEICVAAICAKQDGLMWLQLLKVFFFFFFKG